jgi:hypothetical protein
LKINNSYDKNPNRVYAVVGKILVGRVGWAGSALENEAQEAIVKQLFNYSFLRAYARERAKNNIHGRRNFLG